MFEKQSGEGELVKASKLNKLIKHEMPNLDVVFLAACNSEFVGKIFRECGVKHVICVKYDRYVLDDAAIVFTKTFYHKLFDQINICEAFEAAKAYVEF